MKNIIFLIIVITTLIQINHASENEENHENNDVVAFTIGKEETNSQKVISTMPTGEIISCEFKYKTSTSKKQEKKTTDDNNKKEEEAEKKKKAKTPEITAATIIQQLNGRCASSDKGFWNYEVCIGKHVKQKHNQEHYLMGKTVVSSNSNNPNRKSQRYVDGEVCKAVTGEPKRETTVTYACGSTFKIKDVSETSTCVYSIVVTHQKFCGVKGFSKVPVQNVNTGGISLNNNNEHENWYLEIIPYGTYVRCAIYCVDENTESNGSQLNFHTFNTKLSYGNDGGGGGGGDNSQKKRIQYKKHKIRKIGRKALDGNEYVDVVNVKNGFKLNLKDDFTGSLQHFTMKGHVV